ncbi:MAG TPA: isoprenylcysteine carboxylmethyltransferase family protein [Gammaproteobacteria bacterium]
MNTRIARYRPPRIAFLMLTLAAVLHWTLPYADLVLLAAPSTGAVLLVAGFATMMWAWWLFQRHAVAVCPTAPTAQLLTHGIYALTRNPMYLGMITMMLGIALYFGTLPFFITALAYLVIIDRVFCQYEEDKLEAAFGEEYRCYRARVRRWL